jgi:uncharacterized Ntn-hydrolase superfamily protein
MKPNQFPRFPLAHTFSIVARDAETGQLGVAVQSHWFSVGLLVCWAEPGTGVVATQAIAEVNYGPLGLELMRYGRSPSEALSILLSGDEMSMVRQVAMVNAKGEVAVHTGSRCIAYAGHEIGDGFSVQANTMANDRVVPAMALAYRECKGDLAERLMVSLEAAQAAGGDLRGQQSAALLIVSNQRSKYPWRETIMELRIEDHPEPLARLRSLLQVQRAYNLMNKGDQQLAARNIVGALESYGSASELAPDISELPFWHAVTLADIGRVEEALPLFEQVFKENENFEELVQRLPPAGLLRNDAEMMQRILSVKSRSKK